jgi:hypothetical protein
MDDDDYTESWGLNPAARARLESEAREKGWLQRSPHLRHVGKREEYLPAALPFDWDSDFTTDDRRFASLDTVIEKLIQRGKLPDEIDLAQARDRSFLDQGSSLLEFTKDAIRNAELEITSEKAIVAVRRWVVLAAHSALDSARYSLQTEPNDRADLRQLKKRLLRLAADLSDLFKFIDLPNYATIAPPPETEYWFHRMYLRNDDPFWVPHEEQQYEALSAQLVEIKACVSIARQSIIQFHAKFVETASPSREDVFTSFFIGEMRSLWRILVAQEPSRAASGPFSDFVSAGWQLNNLPLYPGSSGKPRLSKACPHSESGPSTWLGKRIVEQARRGNWPGVRLKKKL